jgi:hypothetical protein
LAEGEALGCVVEHSLDLDSYANTGSAITIDEGTNMINVAFTNADHKAIDEPALSCISVSVIATIKPKNGDYN